MAVDETLLGWVRSALGGADVAEVKMFGGVGFMVHGNMVVAASSRGLLVRAGADAMPQALKKPGASVMEMRGRAMAGYIRVAPTALNARSVATWVRLGCAFVETLPAKTAKAKTTKRKTSNAAKTKAKRTK